MDLAVASVASPIIEKFIQESIACLGTDLTKELDDLQTIILPQLDLVIQVAENSPHKPKLAKWLRRLNEAYYNAEDILDELEYERLEVECHQVRSKANINKRKFLEGASSHPVVKRFADISLGVINRVSLFSPAKRKLRAQLNELKEIAMEGKSLCELLRIQPENRSANKSTPRPSSSLQLNKVFGRDQDRDRIINLITNEPIEESNPAIAIVGIGGSGKTTLAQYIFNDPRVVNYFDVRIWVCLSPKLDVIKNTTEMIESASRNCPHLDSIDALQRELKHILLNSKKTLLVLDDICYNGQSKEEEWSQLLAPFTSQAGKHRIILTSRSKSLPNALYPLNLTDLEELDENEFKLLFRHFAFLGANIENLWLKNELEVTGDKIAGKLCGSPLAAKAVGNRLSRNLDDKEWKNTLDNVNLSDVSDSLLWTYQRLDAQLQRCFLYCSILPKGRMFEIDEGEPGSLFDLWLSENFIKCSDETNAMQKAIEYWHELVACSFFQPIVINGYVRYHIHDLFHDLAEKLAKEDCFRIEGNVPRKIPSTVRYISIYASDLKEHIPVISELNQLRTVVFFIPFVNDVNEVFKHLLSKLKKLRVLSLIFFNNIKLPELVGELKHLRYLEIYHTSISVLPESLSKLYHLQVLLLSASAKTLPQNLSILKKLYQLVMVTQNGKPAAGLPAIGNIGNLTSLETVRQFCVSKEPGFELHQLGKLNRLQGKLRIENLQIVDNKADAIGAKLCAKKDLERLELVWDGDGRLISDFDLELLEVLKPHENLKHLSLENYRAAKYPSWLLKDSIIQNLDSVTLLGCLHLQVLPSNSTPHCDKYVLKWLYKLKDLSHLPKSLTSLSIDGCPSLAFAPKTEPQFSSQDLCLNKAEFIAYWLQLIPVTVFAFYCSLILRNEYVMLSDIPAPKNDNYLECWETIRRVVEDEQPVDEHAIQAWWHCHQQRMDFVYTGSVNTPEFILPSSLTVLALKACNITNGALSDCLRRLTSLTDLRIEEIMTLTTLPSEHVMRHLKRLESLTIIACWCLRSLGFLQGLVSLKKLEVGFCPCLDIKHARDSTTFPVSLESMCLWGCVIPDGIYFWEMPYLQYLEIERCRGLKSLSIGMLTSLKSLKLWNCPDFCKLEGLQSLLCLKDLLLINLPNFPVGSFLETPVGLRWRILQIASSEVLKELSAINAFSYISILHIYGWQEETFTFEGLPCLTSLQRLTFTKCKIKHLPNSLEDLSILEIVYFKECPEISSLPELPESVEIITIEECPLLKERCQAPDGLDWPKIAHIPHKFFAD